MVGLADALGDRMKRNYEQKYFLTRRTPAIMRLDGRAFHTLTKGLDPFNERVRKAMYVATRALLHEIQGAKFAYQQSDEISILITDYDRIETDAWFGYEIQKMCSVAAGIASVAFSGATGKTACFDARVANYPEDEVANYFLWRSLDWERNSLSLYSRKFFSHRALHGKGKAAQHEMLYEIGKNWATDLSPVEKNATFIVPTSERGYEFDYMHLPPQFNLIEDLVCDVLPWRAEKRAALLEKQMREERLAELEDVKERYKQYRAWCDEQWQKRVAAEREAQEKEAAGEEEEEKPQWNLRPIRNQDPRGFA